jgi:hypothetical protein
MSDNLTKRQVDTRFSSLPGVEHGEYEAAADALEAKIARLKKLRLARDAAALAAPPKAVAVKKAAGRKKLKEQKKRPAVSLLDWLKKRRSA